jgi:Ca2+/H+ antiporter, TMEM165/GDT1 family
MKDHSHSHRRRHFLIPLAILALVGVLGFAVYLLWNHVLVQVVGVQSISYWQALGLFVLAKILFGGWPGGHGWRERMMAKRWASLDPEQREHLREEMRRRFGNWSSMTAEQRDQLREEMRQRFGGSPRPPWDCEDRGHGEPGKPGNAS